MVPVEHATDDDTSDEGKSMSACLPLLVFQHQSCQHKNEHEMLMFSVSQKRLLLHAADMAPDLAAGDNMCWTSPQGWMLVVKSTRSPSSSSAAAWLWNPRTGDKITLPDVEAERDDDDDDGIDIPTDCKCLLTRKDATHPECLVVLLDRTEPNMWYCKVVDDGRRRSWRRYTYDIGDYEVPGEDPTSRPPTKRVISSISAVQGEFFFISSHEDMCAISFASASDDDPEFQFFDASMVDFPCGMSSGITWLVESDDQLSLVCVCFVGFDAGNIGAINVYRMDFSTEAWCRVHDIGDAAILLEDTNMAASCPARPLGLKANQIYFMSNFVADDADLCIFDIELEVQEITRVHQRERCLNWRFRNGRDA